MAIDRVVLVVLLLVGDSAVAREIKNLFLAEFPRGASRRGTSLPWKRMLAQGVNSCGHVAALVIHTAEELMIARSECPVLVLGMASKERKSDRAKK
jgi:hypothetical protein